MFLSRIVIDIGDNPDREQPGQRWLRNLYHVHQRLCMAFPSDSQLSDDKDFLKSYKPEEFGAGQVHVDRHKTKAGFLFRVDPHPGKSVAILVQSAMKPDWEYAFHNAGYLLATPPQVKQFDPQFGKDQRLRFRLRANPTKRVGADKADDRLAGKRVQLFGEEQQLDWLRRQGERYGFALIDCRVSSVETQRSRKPEKSEEIRHQAVTFDGLLQVTDPAAFLSALESGIGPAKGFGFGLLSVARG